MITIQCDLFDAPPISGQLKEIIEKLENPDDYVLSLQLDYRDDNTLFYLSKVSVIEFQDTLLKITQRNNSVAFFDYENILEYCVINASEVLNLGELEI